MSDDEEEEGEDDLGEPPPLDQYHEDEVDLEERAQTDEHIIEDEAEDAQTASG